MKNEKFSHREKETIRQIRNSIMHRGRTPSVRELMVSLSYKSPRSVTVIIEQLLSKGVLRRRANRTLQLIKSLNDDEMNARTVDVPLVGTISCGMPMLAEENIEAMIPVSIRLAKPPSRHFLLKAKGDSMDKKDINNGDLVLVRQQTT
ncbi:MAG: S24 family peptidase, partial [Planctomycetota bacterium]